MHANGIPLAGSPLQRLHAELGSAAVGLVKPLAGDVLDVCQFVGEVGPKGPAGQTLAGLLDRATAAVEKENRPGAQLAVKADELKVLVDLALAKKPN